MSKIILINCCKHWFSALALVLSPGFTFHLGTIKNTKVQTLLTEISIQLVGDEIQASVHFKSSQMLFMCSQG